MFSGRKIQLTCRLLGKQAVLLEGTRDSLLFLGELLLAQARFESDCGLEIGPRGPGGIFFSKRSALGVYVHRLPCNEDRREEDGTLPNKRQHPTASASPSPKRKKLARRRG